MTSREMARPLTRDSKLHSIPMTKLDRLGAILTMDGKWKLFAGTLTNRKGGKKFEDYHLAEMETEARPGVMVLRSLFYDNISVGQTVELFLNPELNLKREADFLLVDVLGEDPSAELDEALEEESTDWQDNLILEAGKLRQFEVYQLSQITRGFNSSPLEKGGRFVAKGGFGEVFLGKLNDQELAIKRFMKKSDAKEQEFTIKQFQNEMEVQKGLDHKNILPLFGYCEAAPCFVVYPYMAFGSLEDCLACKHGKSPLAGWSRVPIVRGIADGICYLHTSLPGNPLIHTDIKSANILLDKNTTPKICDFGLMRTMTINSNTTKIVTSDVTGTFCYMPPEGFDCIISPKWDIYSFGVIIIEILTGLRAWDDNRSHKSLKGLWEEAENQENLVDPKGQPWPPGTVTCLMELADQCLEPKRHERPEIQKVVEQLELLKCMSDA